MANTTDLDLIAKVVEGQRINVMEATEAGADKAKIDYLEGTPAEIVERIGDLSRSVRGMFMVRCWNDETAPGKAGRPTTKSAPFTWRINGTGGGGYAAPSAPAVIAAPVATHTGTEYQKQADALAELRLQLEVMRQSHKYEREIADLRAELDDEGPDVPEPDPTAAAERIAGIVERILDRVLPYIKPRAPGQPVQPITGPPMDVDRSTQLMIAIERFRAVEPEQYAAIERNLIDNYGQSPEPIPNTPKDAVVNS